MGNLKIILQILLLLLFSCESKDEKPNDLTLDNRESVPFIKRESNCSFSDSFIKKMEGIGFEVYSKQKIKGDSITNKSLTKMFLYNFRTPYKDSVFKEPIEEQLTFKFAKNDDPNRKESSKSLIILIELTLKDFTDMEKVKIKYDGILNAVVTDRGDQISRTFYSTKCKKIYFLRDVEAVITPGYQTAEKLMRLTEQEYK